MASDDGDPIVDREPEVVRLIFDIDTMRVVADPLRARILETMAGRPAGSWSVRELADCLSVPQTRLYHHIALLVRHHLIRAVERRLVSRIVETRYRIAARSIQLDPGMFGGAAASAGPDEPARFRPTAPTIASAFEDARRDAEAAVASGLADLSGDPPPERRLVLDRAVLMLTPARAAELHERLFALADEFGADEAADGVAIGMFLALYPSPTVDQPTDPSDD